MGNVSQDKVKANVWFTPIWLQQSYMLAHGIRWRAWWLLWLQTGEDGTSCCPYCCFSCWCFTMCSHPELQTTKDITFPNMRIISQDKVKANVWFRRFSCGNLTCWLMGPAEGPGRCWGSRLVKMAPLDAPTVASAAGRRSPLARPDCAIDPCARPNTGGVFESISQLLM